MPACSSQPVWMLSVTGLLPIQQLPLFGSE